MASARSSRPSGRRARPGVRAAAIVATALLVEALDELVDGTKGAAFPLIRAGLGLSYGQVGLLIAVPLVVGSLIELPLGLVAGYGRRRNRFVLAGGIAFAGALAVTAFAQSFWVLLFGLVAFFPASGAFVSLTQAALMDADPSQHQRRMAAWNLAGSAGALAGPLLLAGVLVGGGTWRTGYLLLAWIALATTAVAAVSGPARRWPDRPNGPGEAGCGDADAAEAGGAEAGGAEAGGGEVGLSGEAGCGEVGLGGEPGEAGEGGADCGDADAGEGNADDEGDQRSTVGEALRAVRDGQVARWLILLQVIDLLLDVLTGYVGLYLVDVVHVSPALAAAGVAVRLGAGLAGDAIWVVAARRLAGRTALRASAIAAAGLYPAVLLLPWFGAKLAALAALSVVTACWYPVAQAELYGSLPGRSGVALFWSSAAGLAGAAGPLLVGLVAQRLGLSWALAGLAITPVVVLAVLPPVGDRTSRTVAS